MYILTIIQPSTYTRNGVDAPAYSYMSDGVDLHVNTLYCKQVATALCSSKRELSVCKSQTRLFVIHVKHLPRNCELFKLMGELGVKPRSL